MDYVIMPLLVVLTAVYPNPRPGLLVCTKGAITPDTPTVVEPTCPNGFRRFDSVDSMLRKRDQVAGDNVDYQYDWAEAVIKTRAAK